MQNADRVLRFTSTPKLRPAKATLSEDTRAGVDHLIAMAPILGQTNPDSVPTVEHLMENLIGDAPPTNDDGGHKHPGYPAWDDLESPVLTETPRRQAARLKLRQMRQAALLRDRQIGEELKRNSHQCLMALLRDMAGNVSSAA